MPYLDAAEELAIIEEYKDREQIIYLDANPPPLVNYPLTDYGNALRMNSQFGGMFRFVSERKQWIVWNGKRWDFDEKGEVVRRFIRSMQSAISQFSEIATPDDPEAKKRHEALGAFLMRNTNQDRITNGINQLKFIEGRQIGASELDAHSMFLGTPSGCINLTTGKFKLSGLGDYITKSIAVDYDAQATCPRWMKFLTEITPGHPELIPYLQRCVGYSLTGSVKEECLFFLSGEGQNGKGTFVETLQKLMQDYSKVASMTLFIKDPNGNANSYDVAHIAGSRFVTASELEEGTYWDEAKIKAITGGDTCTARQIYCSPFDFLPQHKLWVSGNRRPLVKGTDNGIWRRMKLIQFEADFKGEKNDSSLKAVLLTELPGILNWAIQGCLDWQEQGLNQPTCIAEWTDEYRRSEDVLGLFIADRLEPDPQDDIRIAKVFSEYQDWCEEQGISPKYQMSAIALCRKMKGRGMDISNPRKSGNRLIGYRVRESFPV